MAEFRLAKKPVRVGEAPPLRFKECAPEPLSSEEIVRSLLIGKTIADVENPDPGTGEKVVLVFTDGSKVDIITSENVFICAHREYD